MKLLIKRLSIEESSHLPKLDIPKLVLSPTTRIEPLSPTILNSPLKKRQFRNIDGVLVVIAILGIGFSWSISNTTAKLKTQAILKSTTIMTKSAPVTKYADHIVFRDVVLRCSNDNSLSSSLRPQITLFNPTNKNIVTHNWHIEDNSGNIYTLPINFVFHPRHIYELALHLSNGLQYVSDHLTLYNDLNVPVDGLSWGSDTTLLNPALPVLTAGTRLIRKPPRIDTNTSNDWQIHSHKCHENENECEKDTEADINNIRENKETDE